ncbi:MAG: hypothetical protein CRU78_16640 [Candidatus Accumulibacter phosphatis]|uniref:ABC transporter domain-containing protein n=1 Tax=Candidatus Accumulibacter phosphatis TaxID=327160 RepID=A0A6A7RX43_9PROT|nr:hypothetical protein [Candidatus Accumulibacter phosphatis]
MHSAYTGTVAVITDQEKRLRAAFCFEQGKIYTLQGANQIGKTLLVKLLTGAVRTAKSDFRVDGATVKFDSPASANSHGICAVYQDDDLLPTMRVDEQIALRHLTPSLQYFFELFVRFALLVLHQPLPAFSSAAHWVESHLPQRRLREQEIKKAAKELLASYSPDDASTNYVAHFTSRPSALSGGAKAVIKLVSAQLTPGLKYLFLDEVFRGVQPSVWPGIIRSLKNWAATEGIAIVAITHSEDEVVRWNPKQRLILREATNSEVVLEPIPPAFISRLAAGIPIRIGSYPVVEINVASESLKELCKDGPFHFLFDEKLKGQPPYRRLRETLNPVSETSLSGGESVKDWANYEKIALQLVNKSLRTDGCLVIIGGGSIINFGGFLAATLNRGMRFVLVPTTVMAIADVAVGSKTSLNLGAAQKDGRYLKHPIGLYANPDHVILDSEFLEWLPLDQKKIGLAECIKHGICQHKELWEKATELLKGSSGSAADWYEVAVETMHLKSDMLSIDPWETDESLILLYGHLHAHALERALKFDMPHGIAVYWGMLIDLHLAKDDRFDLLKSALLQGFGSDIQKVMMIEEVSRLGDDPDLLMEAYENDTKVQHKMDTGYSILILSPWGQQISREPRKKQAKKFSFDEIHTAVRDVSHFLGSGDSVAQHCSYRG